MSELIQSWLLDPTALLFLVSLVVGFVLIRRRSRSSKRARPFSLWLLVIAWFAIYLVCSAPSVVNPLLTILEDQYADNLACEAGSHVIVLGGGVDSRVASVQEFERMSVATLSRATEGARIALAEPSSRLVVAGGPVTALAEADVIASYWNALGIADSRIVRDSLSANTRENALNVASLLEQETVTGPVRLVTSALHMPRAMRSFEKALESTEISLCPVSVDRQALLKLPLWAWIPQTSALVKFDKFLHEIAALTLYRINEWI